MGISEVFFRAATFVGFLKVSGILLRFPTSLAVSHLRRFAGQGGKTLISAMATTYAPCKGWVPGGASDLRGSGAKAIPELRVCSSLFHDSLDSVLARARAREVAYVVIKIVALATWPLPKIATARRTIELS